MRLMDKAILVPIIIYFYLEHQHSIASGEQGESSVDHVDITELQ